MGISPSTKDNNMNFTILIGSCDRYQFLWNNFTTLFNKYWDHSIEVEKYFISETAQCNVDGFQTFNTNTNIYSDSLKYALDRVKTKYVLWLQDDYYFRKTVSRSKFEYYMNYIIENKVNRFGIHDDSQLYSKNHVVDNIYRFRQSSLYTISMQASIWDVEFFKYCLPSVNSETPWEFEVDGSRRINADDVHNIQFEKQNFGDEWYLEAMRKGQFTDWYKQIIKDEGLPPCIMETV
jgi:hypothetical protein